MIVLSALYYQFVEAGPVRSGEEEAVAWAMSKAALSAKLFEPGKLVSEIAKLPAHVTAALLGDCYINSDVNLALANTFRQDNPKQLHGFKISFPITARGVQGLLPTLARAKHLAEGAIASQQQWGAPTLAAATAQIQHAAGLRVTNPARHLQLAEDPKAPKLLTLNTTHAFVTSMCLLARSEGAPFSGDIFATKDGRALAPSKVCPCPAHRSHLQGMVRSASARAWTRSPVILFCVCCRRGWRSAWVRARACPRSRRSTVMSRVALGTLRSASCKRLLPPLPLALGGCAWLLACLVRVCTLLPG